MSSETSGTGFGPTRTALIKGGDALFAVLLLGMLALGVLVVAIQAVGLVTGSTALAADLGKATLTPIMCAVAGSLGIFSLVLAKLHGWKSTD